MRRTFLILALLASPALAQTPAPTPPPVIVPVEVSPKAVAVAKATYPSGGIVFVNATGSRSADPVRFMVLDRPDEPSFETKDGLGVIFPALPDGDFFVAVIATAPKGYSGESYAFALVKFTVGVAPKPIVPDIPPTPVVPDVPSPAPATPLQGIGKAYAAADVQAMAATWEESATMLAAGTAAAEIAKTFGARWQARRIPSFAAAGAAFAAILPAGTEPKDQATRDQLAGAWRDFAAGLRLGVR